MQKLEIIEIELHHPTLPLAVTVSGTLDNSLTSLIVIAWKELREQCDDNFDKWDCDIRINGIFRQCLPFVDGILGDLTYDRQFFDELT